MEELVTELLELLEQLEAIDQRIAQIQEALDTKFGFVVASVVELPKNGA